MDCICVGVQKQDLFIVVEGQGTAKYCSELNACIEEILLHIDIQKIYFDTKKASYLDSSFIGLMLSFKKRQISKDFVLLLNPSDKIVDIFHIMGLESFIPSIYDDKIFCNECNIKIDQKSEHSIADIKLLLESHQHIMATNSENYKRFILVEKVFQQELNQKRI